jgi:hypothetical protein
VNTWDNKFHILIGTADNLNGLSWNLYVDGSQNGQLNENLGITQDTGNMFIGYSGANNEWWWGDIAEVLVFNRVISTNDRQNIEGYLAWKWGLQATLPSDHTYKFAPPSV